MDLRQVDISRVLHFTGRHSRFMDCFEHVRGRYVKGETNDQVIAACLVAWGTNMGLEPVHLDCCDGCLTCCASYTAAPAPKPLVLLDTAVQARSFADQEPSGSPFSIWHPPRA